MCMYVCMSIYLYIYIEGYTPRNRNTGALPLPHFYP